MDEDDIVNFKSDNMEKISLIPQPKNSPKRKLPNRAKYEKHLDSLISSISKLMQKKVV